MSHKLVEFFSLVLYCQRVGVTYLLVLTFSKNLQISRFARIGWYIFHGRKIFDCLPGWCVSIGQAFYQQIIN